MRNILILLPVDLGILGKDWGSHERTELVTVITKFTYI